MIYLAILNSSEINLFAEVANTVFNAERRQFLLINNSRI